jgi:Fe-S-cluster containining protein
VHAVDPEIFRRRYFGHCLRCTFCGDACCQHGVDVAVVERDRILAHAAEIQPLVRVPADQWFEPEVQRDDDFPGGSVTRTSVVDGACVFLQRDARGCVLHAFALSRGLDYHDVKPMISALFPLTFDGEALRCSDELSTGSLVCAGAGPTAYEMARDELRYYFGAVLVAELDGLAESE